MTGFHSVAAQGHRGVLRLSGADAKSWLENLISNDVLPTRDGMPVATLAALLSPQGKILFDLHIVDVGDHLLIETGRPHVASLAQRLGLYKLRAAVVIEPVPDWSVYVGPADCLVNPGAQAVVAVDGRSAELGLRIYVQGALTEVVDARAAYTAHRVRLGIPEASIDYALGQTFPHEANYDALHGVSFTKGCFIGQEVVARMQNKAVVRKRIVRLTGAGLVGGCEIKAGAAPIGTVGTVVGQEALATVRLDRVVDALEHGTPLLAGAAPVIVAPEAIAAYRKAVAERPAAPEF